MPMDAEKADGLKWRRLFRLGVPVGLALLVSSLAVLGLLYGPGTLGWALAEWTRNISVIVVAGSLIGVAFTDRPGQRRRLLLRLLAGFIAVTVIVGTLFIGLVTIVGCAMSPTSYVGWGCRGASVYWPDPLILMFGIWIVAGGLVWLSLREASTDSA
jgi:hypothetical protein